MADIIDDKGLDTLFREARTYNGWQDKDVSDVLIKATYDLVKYGATSANCCPARFVFVKSASMREKLAKNVDGGNVAKVLEAPVTVVIGHDMKFYDHLSKLFPHDQTARSWFADQPDVIEDAAFRNGTLQGAYLMLAARALGLDCGPMSGFNKKAVRDSFFPNSDVEVNFICSLGYGKKDSIFPRSPRFDFAEACSIV